MTDDLNEEALRRRLADAARYPTAALDRQRFRRRAAIWRATAMAGVLALIVGVAAAVSVVSSRPGGPVIVAQPSEQTDAPEPPQAEAGTASPSPSPGHDSRVGSRDADPSPATSLTPGTTETDDVQAVTSPTPSAMPTSSQSPTPSPSPSKTADGGTESETSQRSWTVNLPHHDWEMFPAIAHPPAVLRADPDRDGGCVWYEVDGRRWSVRWPPGYRARFTEQPDGSVTAELVNSSGEVVAREGDARSVSAGSVEERLDRCHVSDEDRVWYVSG